MYCSRCGAQLVPDAAFCAKCGAAVVQPPAPAPRPAPPPPPPPPAPPAYAPVAAPAVAPPPLAPPPVHPGPPPIFSAPTPSTVPVVITRPGIVTFLAVLHFIGAAFWFLGGLGSLGVSSGADAAGALFMMPVFIGLGAAQLFCGIGLLKLKPYGRTLQLIFAWIGLIGIPVGTIISVLILIYMFKPGIKLIFSGRPGDDFTPEEAAQIKADTASSGGTTVIIVIVCVILGIMVIGMIAAISVPALLRARTSANEVTAIASLRSIVSAEVTYSSTCAQGGYAVSLEDLGKPPLDGSRPFLSADLSRSGVEKSGYRFTVTRDRSPITSDVATAAATCNGASGQPASSYFAWAEPVNSGSGVRYFAVDGRGTIYESLQPISNPIMDSSGVTPIR